MRNEECFTPSVEDENVDRSFDALRLKFKELYDEIDFLGEQATLTVQSITNGNGDDSEVFQKSDIEDLIVYARKFVRETRKTIVSFDEHGVQCEPEKRSNKKVSTPKAWLQPPPPERSIVRDEMWEYPFRDQSAITVTQDIPINVSSVLSDQVEPLNNKVTVATAPDVRSIGTNVNFVSQRTVAKRTNVQRVVQPSTCRAARCSSAAELRPRPVVKIRPPPATAPASTSSKRPGKPPIRTFSDDQFKRLLEKFIQMQTEKHATGSSEKVSQDIENEVKEQLDGQATNSNEHNVQSVVSNESKDSAPNNKLTDKEPIELSPAQDKKSELVDTAEETFGFTSHVLPGVSIKGRWDANLKVQQTGNIAILAEKDTTDDEPPNNNVLYVELKRGQTRNVKENVPNEKLPTVTVESPKDVASESSKLCADAEDPETLTTEDTIDSDCKATSYPGSKPCEPSQIRIPRSARNVIRHSNKPNKYLDPFVNMPSKKGPSKKNTEELFDIFDDDSSSSNTEEDFEEDDIRMLLNLNDNGNRDVLPTLEPESLKTEHTKKLPTSVQCQRSLLEVSIIPTLHSPSEISRENESSESEHETVSNGHSSSHFLKNLRIWKSALEVQSQNMKITNELTENLDVLKGNIEKIAQESSKVAKIAKHVENAAADKEAFPRQVIPVRPEPSPLRSRSCECFGCQSTFEEVALRPTTSPSHGHKQFQRAVFERNPRYAKTIRKICQLGSSERPPISVGADRDETIKKAAQKFLFSLHGNGDHRRCYSSGSSCGLVNSPSKSMSNGSDDAGDSTLTLSENEYLSDQEEASVSFSTCADFKSNGSSLGQIASSERTDLSSFTINFNSQSDMGEVLSPGEIK